MSGGGVGVAPRGGVLGAFLLGTVLAVWGPASASAQDGESIVSLDAGVVLTSRFVYRGINLGEAPRCSPGWR